MAIISTAGDPAHFSRQVLEHAMRDPMWRVHQVLGPAPWTDPARLAEQRRRLPESVYRRLFENRWTEAADRVATLEEIRACVTLDGPQEWQPGRTYVIGLDIGLRRDRTVACVCHAERVTRPAEFEGLAGERIVGVKVVLDRMEVWEPRRGQTVQLADVEAWLEHASKAYRGAKIIFDGWQAQGTMQRLKARGISVLEFVFSATSVGRLASTLLVLLQGGLLALPDDRALIDELANLRLRKTDGNAYRLDHDPDRHDDRAIALALAAQYFASTLGPSKPDTSRPYVPRTLTAGLRDAGF